MASPEIAVIIPTFNESENVPLLVRRLADVLAGQHYEIIFVDDHSPDGTADVVRALSREDGRIRILERLGRRGLSTAVIEGLMATSAAFGIVMDGDLQHDECLLPPMIEALRDGAELVVATRYGAGGGTGEWSQSRRLVSLGATKLSRLLHADSVSDPMSGFFAVQTQVFRKRAGQLTGTGYKILIDLLSTSGPPLNIRELPYVFQNRQHGESKLSSRVALEFIELMIAKTIGRLLPTKFVMFIIVGTVGVGVHFLVLSTLFGPLTFGAAQGLATVVAMTSNFFINNVFTYYDRRLAGWKLVPGLISFCAASSVGLLANVGIAVYLFAELETVWYLSALAGILVGATWNYVVTALYTWRS